MFENLDLTPIHPILWIDLHTEGPGRPVEYDPEWDLKHLRRNPNLRKVCGYGDRAPCEAHFTQMKKRIEAEGFHILEV